MRASWASASRSSRASAASVAVPPARARIWLTSAKAIAARIRLAPITTAAITL